jgi:hypothetical protein
MRLKCELAEQFARILGDTLEPRVVAVRLLDLVRPNHERTVTQAEVAALAKKLQGPARTIRSLIHDGDYPALWALLPGARDLFLQALDRLMEADSRLRRGRVWPGTRSDLYLSYLTTAWRETYGEEPKATTEFVRVVEAAFAAHDIPLASELEDWTARALKRIQTSTAV